MKVKSYSTKENKKYAEYRPQIFHSFTKKNFERICKNCEAFRCLMKYYLQSHQEELINDE